ncbi:transcription termination/antitermination protein NusG [Rhizobium sp. L51/94]|uniref:transcription termination/antitermination protein NusG n=1 Tax=Rhizobium sp. L51/94 TaxID=2819999 RepID=UPI001C5B6DE4|nr:transcription termination/antitermination NusG family protein [Rhizobium sp. L51/94]QXZ79646.1 transcription antiterminator [Rhizobium sp. L51/94]
MMMRHKNIDFSGVDLSGYVSVPVKTGGEVHIRKSSMVKMGNASDGEDLRIDQLSMASTAVIDRIIRDYPEFESVKPAWICLRVVTGRERSVEKNLIKADVEALVVMSNPTKVCIRKRVREVPARPVIAGYVLVRCRPIAAAMLGLLAVDDVIDVVGGAISPFIARAEEIDKFKVLAEQGKYDNRGLKGHAFMVGEQVRVTDGPFASFPGLVHSIDDEKGVVSVEIAIFGRPTPCELDLDQIEKM